MNKKRQKERRSGPKTPPTQEGCTGPPPPTAAADASNRLRARARFALGGNITAASRGRRKKGRERERERGRNGMRGWLMMMRLPACLPAINSMLLHIDAASHAQPPCTGAYTSSCRTNTHKHAHTNTHASIHSYTVATVPPKHHQLGQTESNTQRLNPPPTPPTPPPTSSQSQPPLQKADK